ncbi:hypothetical protein EGM88_02470 [Aureibaculum marinum]|uniref:DUF4157 domain-containing protein n=1 Tax=Aureibaculum marinum TaxID=2487930 RepID=A0A3N4NZ94_9FLAO|nr:hypothetical protein [Aureibaculum marinum]RPE00148.1 hypothetical protein EGM88_02470 [Aureibaculum marinum]
MILFSRYLIPKNYTGLAIYPFIFLKNKSLSDNWVLINHERIHLKQQLELLWIFFFIWYTLEFLFHLVVFRNWHKAYKNISFEKEAYQNEGNPNYLNERKPWSFLEYL